MGAKAGISLKFLQWFIRGIQFLCAALILGVYSYFLATLHNHDLRIATSLRAVEGISGAAVLYTIIGLLLLCCVAGLAFTSFVAMVLDVAFIGAFIYVAVANKGGASSCKGYLDTPFGKGNSRDTTDSGSDGFTSLPSYHTACRLQSACFAVSIIAIIFFIFSILTELALVRHHRKAKRFGPSPDNNYTSGYGAHGGKKPGILGRLMSRRSRRSQNTTGDANALPEHAHPADLHQTTPAHARPSYNTDTTAIGENPDYHKAEAGYGGYHTQPLQHHQQQQYGIATDHPGHTHGSRPTTQGSGRPQNYRYDDGVY